MAVVIAGMGVFLFALVWVVAGDAFRHAPRRRRDDLRAVAGRDGRDDLLLDAGLRDPCQRARHLRLRRRPAQPQRAVADATRAQHPDRGALMGRLPDHPESLGSGRQGRRRRRGHPGDRRRSRCGACICWHTWSSCWRWRPWCSAARSSEVLRRVAATLVVLACVVLVVALPGHPARPGAGRPAGLRACRRGSSRTSPRASALPSPMPTI